MSSRESDIDVTYVPYSVRSFERAWWLLLPMRLTRDILLLIRQLKNCDVVHVAANSGIAVVRSLAAVLVSKLFGKRVLLDVRGNALDAFSEQRCGIVSSCCWRGVLALSDGCSFSATGPSRTLSRRYPDKISHQPNMFSDSEIPPVRQDRLTRSEMRVLFVGYCYRDKGVFDIVEGCHLACSRGLEIDLTFIGQEHGEFSEYLDSRLPCENLSIHRLGKQSREVFLRLMGQSDIFLFPTYHKGEGHPNVINEAMAHAVPLIVTDCGAIGEILDTETAYFVAPLSPIQIADALGHVDANREEARRRANRARDRLISRYAASHLLARLRQTYVDLAASEGRQAIDSVGKLG